MATETTYQSNGQNIGYNAKVTFVPNNGGSSFSADAIGNLMKVSSTQNHKLHETVPMSGNGYPIIDISYYGWAGEMDFVRFNGNIMAIFQQLEANQFNGGIPIKWTIQVQTLNPDGSINTDAYQNCVLWGAGPQYAADKPVDQKLYFAATQCVSTSQTTGVFSA